MHEFYVSNENQSIVVDDAVYLEKPFWTCSTWLAIAYLPHNPRILGKVALQLVGRLRAGIEPIEQRTGCTVKVYTKNSKSPHVCVLGERSEDVIACRKLVQKRVSVVCREISAETRSNRCEDQFV
jgi:hypothetical protein